VAASPVDMLICGLAAGRDLTILTTDKYFLRCQQTLSIQFETV
jgi:predicted nucleic acid-binding protein